MHFQEHRSSCCVASGVIVLFTFALLVLSACAEAAETKAPSFGSPTKYKKYHVHYDVNADGTYIEQNEFVMTVVNEVGVQVSGQLPVGMPNGPMVSPRGREVEVLSAYTLKKSGERINAIPWKPQQGTPGGARPVSPLVSVKVMAFQKVEIGDDLVVSFKATLKEPLVTNEISISQLFPKFQAYDDAEISLNAPTSLNLRFETSGAGKEEHVVTGSIQKWVWKYRNVTPEILQVDQQPSPDMFSKVHISTFKDDAAEMVALQELARSPPPPSTPENERCLAIPNNPNDGPEALELFSSQIADLFWRSDEFLQRAVNDWNTPACIFDDGRPRLSALSYGYSQAFHMEKDWSKIIARVEHMKKKFPKEAFVALAEASYWVIYAWDARGGGYASSVSDDGWKLSRERLERAESVLLDTKPYAAELPGWYDEMINVQSALGRPEDERDKVFLEGVTRYPTYYPTYFTMLNFLLPKWGGTWRTVDNLAQWSVEHTREAEGMSMYARLYWVVSGEPKVRLFKNTFASWPKMKKGFEDIMARHPNSKWNLNNFAKFACMAGDKKAFLALRGQIGKDVIYKAWPKNTSLDLCETKFGYAE